MLFSAEDRKKFGNNKVFKPLIDQLNSLQNDGIKIDFKNFKIVKLIPCVVVGDNLDVIY